MSHWQFQPEPGMPPVEGPKEMACPQCSRPMIKGKALMENTWLGSIFVSLSDLVLVFRSAGQKPNPLLHPGGSKDAFRCEGCGSVVFVGQGAADTLCLSCGASMAAGAKTCSRCGWSFETSAPAADGETPAGSP